MVYFSFRAAGWRCALGSTSSCAFESQAATKGAAAVMAPTTPMPRRTSRREAQTDSLVASLSDIFHRGGTMTCGLRVCFCTWTFFLYWDWGWD